MQNPYRSNIDQLVIPYLNKLKTENTDKRHEYQNILETNLNQITSPFLKNMAASYKKLSPRELEVCALIKDGIKTKEIAGILGVSKGTINTYRNNIREKLDIASTNVNLRSFLLTR